nr:hypothetical protein [Bordetella sp. H567]
MARAPVFAGLPAPRHPSARLRPEESQAGIQARSLRTLFRHAGPYSRRRRQGTDDGAHPVAGTGGGGRSRSCPVPRAQRPVPARRLRRGARGGAGRTSAGAAAGTQRDAEGRPQRSLPLRQRQEVQAVPRQAGVRDTR